MTITISVANAIITFSASYVTILPPPFFRHSRIIAKKKQGGFRPPLWYPFRGLLAKHIVSQLEEFCNIQL